MRVAVVVIAFFGATLAAITDKDVIPESESGGTSQLKIMNGEEVIPHSIPYQVYLNISNTASSFSSCGGTLITTTFVLTAAHCLDGALSALITLGAHNLAQPATSSVTANSKTLIVHEDYDDINIINDIGLIELDRIIALSETIQTARLPSFRDVGTNLEGETAIVSGWGLTNGAVMSNVLLRINNTILSNKECHDSFEGVNSEEICFSSADGRSPCQADSGGPLVIGDVQYGILSYGTTSCTAESPTVFTRITSFLNWIQNHSNWNESSTWNIKFMKCRYNLH